MTELPSPVAALYRKAWKGAEILFVLGLRGVSYVTGRPVIRKTADRKVLDQQLLPTFTGDPRYRRVLFVGCDWYTRHYETMFRERDYWTLEREADRARFGARQHITGDLADLGRHFPDGSLDLIVCNGVIGWGLNEPVAVETAMRACVNALAPGGALILGWNDIPEKLPVPLSRVEALEALEPFPAPLRDEIRTATYNHHTYKVLRRPLSDGPHEPPFDPEHTPAARAAD